MSLQKTQKRANKWVIVRFIKVTKWENEVDVLVNIYGDLNANLSNLENKEVNRHLTVTFTSREYANFLKNVRDVMDEWHYITYKLINGKAFIDKVIFPFNNTEKVNALND